MSDKKLMQTTERDVRRLSDKKPARFILGIALYGGTLGLLFVVPMIAGAYLGRWLDSLSQGYSMRWTLSLILLGIAVGTYNVMHFLRKQ